jgi:hypothetical protein
MLVENEDYYINEEGLMVFTSNYHVKKGRCCGNGCRHCPYDFENVAIEKKALLQTQGLPIILHHYHGKSK